MSRGEIWSVGGGVYAAKPRPAVVIQDDAFDATASVTVVPLTTVAVDDALVRVAVPAASATGIDHDSFAMADKITTVRRDQLGAAVDADLLIPDEHLHVFADVLVRHAVPHGVHVHERVVGNTPLEPLLAPRERPDREWP